MTTLNEMTCQCQPTKSEIQKYKDIEGRVIGGICKGCRVEKVIREYAIDVPDSSEPFVQTRLPSLHLNPAFQIQIPNQDITFENFADILKPGDHIAWQRYDIYWHHAILEEVNASKSEISVINWKNERPFRIIRETIKMDKNSDRMSRIDYPDDILLANRTELVLARARSRLDDTGYCIWSDNCESFATYCKCGVAMSHQIVWSCQKFTDVVFQILKTLTKIDKCKIQEKCIHGMEQLNEFLTKNVLKSRLISSEEIETFVKGIDLIATGFAIIIDGYCTILDLKQAYDERRNCNVSRNEFIEVAIKNLVGRLVTNGLTIAGSLLLPELIGYIIGSPLGPTGVFFGTIVGGLLGGGTGIALGTSFGSRIGKWISKSFKTDDRAVWNIKDLQPGDHIVLYAWILHPRCHAIVIEHNCSDEIKVIFNSYKNGVVEVWVSFSQPLYKVEYPPNTCYDQRDVISNARKKIGEKNIYNLATYNCKTFARRCKLKMNNS